MLLVALEFFGHTDTEKFGRGAHFLLHNQLVLFMFGLGLGALPWELSVQQVHQNVGDGLHVVTSALGYH